MPTKRFDNLSQDRRDTILNQARASFIENGYDGASLNEIILKAGISKGSFYYYFEDKSDLYLTVLKQEYYHITDSLDGVLEKKFTDDFWGDIRKYCLHISLYTFNNPDVMKLVTGYYSLSPEDMQKESFQELFRLHLEIVESILKRGQELGEIRTDIPNELMNMALFKLGELMDQWTLEHADITSEDDIKSLSLTYADLFRRITCAAPVYGGGEK